MSRIRFSMLAFFISVTTVTNIAHAKMDCSDIEEWNSTSRYEVGALVQQDQVVYQANWVNQNQLPKEFSNKYQEWILLGPCRHAVDSIPFSSLSNMVSKQSPLYVSMIFPRQNQVFKEGKTLSLRANAKSIHQDIKQVEFFVDGESVGKDSDEPYSVSWVTESGWHNLYAVVLNKNSVSKQSQGIDIWVDKVPVSKKIPSFGISAFGRLHHSLVTNKKSIASFEKASTRNAFIQNSSERGEYAQSDTQNVSFWIAKQVGSFDHYVSEMLNHYTMAVSMKSSQSSTARINHVKCKPEGIFSPQGEKAPYCFLYDDDGREKMGKDHPRRVVGFFSSWRDSGNPQTSFLVNKIPWDVVTHIHYAFAGINKSHQITVGDTQDPNNPAVGIKWPNVDLDPALGFAGHFGALATYKKKHDVKTLLSVGGWRDTGGYSNTEGKRLAEGGFYTLTLHPDGTVNHQGIKAFTDSAVATLRQYKFDGIDINYVYPTSMTNTGNPDDEGFSAPRRPYIWAGYHALMKALRNALDEAGYQDKQYYLLTAAAPSSANILRGMKVYDVSQYLDYINIMSFDFHGAWNAYVGHHAALYDTGEDAELVAKGVYTDKSNQGIGYLNTDWAYHYFRGAMPAGRINIGVPLYTRGWRNVKGGKNGLWGTAVLAEQSQCPAGTGMSKTNPCGDGAVGINNLWTDIGLHSNEIQAGTNPLWHARNLLFGIFGSYAKDYGLTPSKDSLDKLDGLYEYNVDTVAVAPWIWHEKNRVFLSIEDKESLATKLEYVIEQEVGGVMFWDMAGDYDCFKKDSAGVRTKTKDMTENACLSGKGEFHFGDTLMRHAYKNFLTAPPYGNAMSTRKLPSKIQDISVAVTGFKVGDQNIPINPKITLTNQTGNTLAGGVAFEFDVPTSTSDQFKDLSGGKLKVIESGGNKPDNIGGIEGTFHRIRLTLPEYFELKPKESYTLDLVYYLPISGLSNFTLKVGEQSYSLAFPYQNLGLNGYRTFGKSISYAKVAVCNTSGVPQYPNWMRGSWLGKADHAEKGDKMAYEGSVYEAKWWTNSVPGSDPSWKKLCG